MKKYFCPSGFVLASLFVRVCSRLCMLDCIFVGEYAPSDCSHYAVNALGSKEVTK